jgi:hypothetical protein
MSAKAIKTPLNTCQVFSAVVSRAWVSAAWRDKPNTRIVPSKRTYSRKDNRKAITDY